LLKSCQKNVKKLSKKCKKLSQQNCHNLYTTEKLLLHKKAAKSFLHSLTICDKVASGNNGLGQKPSQLNQDRQRQARAGQGRTSQGRLNQGRPGGEDDPTCAVCCYEGSGGGGGGGGKRGRMMMAIHQKI
jgi:hypothetical protein